MKQCTACKELKTLDSFNFRNSKLGYRHSKCRECEKINSRKRYSENINGTKDKSRKATNRWRYKNEYGVSEELSKRLLNDNTGNCEICNNQTSLFVDHCHSKKSFRGLLCRSCNLMLGYAKDNIETLLSGAKYLEKGI